MTIFVLSGVLAAGVILGLSIGYFRVQHWKQKTGELKGDLKQALASKREACMAAYANGVEMGMSVPRRPVADDPVDRDFARLVVEVRTMLAGRRGQPPCAEDLAMTEARQQSLDDAKDRPWLKRKPIYPLVCDRDDVAFAALLVSLEIDPPARKV